MWFLPRVQAVPPETISLHLHCCVSSVFRQSSHGGTLQGAPAIATPHPTSEVKSGWERQPVPKQKAPDRALVRSGSPPGELHSSQGNVVL